eukprot:gene8784-9686_t
MYQDVLKRKQRYLKRILRIVGCAMKFLRNTGMGNCSQRFQPIAIKSFHHLEDGAMILNYFRQSSDTESFTKDPAYSLLNEIFPEEMSSCAHHYNPSGGEMIANETNTRISIDTRKAEGPVRDYR